MLTLISATPSPYARKNRVALHEKNIPFTLESEIPWHSNTNIPHHNPLEKLPVLIFNDGSGRAPIYESWLIQEYIVTAYRGTGPDLMPSGPDDQFMVRKIQVLADGACDAMTLIFFEISRGELKSQEWLSRQNRKVEGALKACSDLVKKKTGNFLVGGEFSIADIAMGAMLGMMHMVETQFGLVTWMEKYPELKRYWEMLEERESFKTTRPVMFELSEKVA